MGTDKDPEHEDKTGSNPLRQGCPTEEALRRGFSLVYLSRTVSETNGVILFRIHAVTIVSEAGHWLAQSVAIILSSKVKLVYRLAVASCLSSLPSRPQTHIGGFLTVI